MATRANRTDKAYPMKPEEPMNPEETIDIIVSEETILLPPSPVVWGQEAEKVGNEFFGETEEFYGSITNFSTAIVLNGQGDSVFGIFIKNEDLPIVGWDFSLSQNHGGIGRNHGFKPKDGKPPTKTPGILFPSPYLYIVDVSPRYMEIKRPKDKDHIHPELTRGAIVGIHADRDGILDSVNQKFYEELKGHGLVTLRSIYLIYFANELGQILHKIPFALSVHGGSAYSISMALRALREAHTPVLNIDGFSHYLWNPEFTSELVGAEEQQYCTLVARDESGYKQRAGIVRDTLEEISEKFAEIRKSNANFSWKFFKDNEAYHPLALKAAGDVTPTNMLSASNSDCDLPSDQSYEGNFRPF